jgi:hypothetical protein
VVSGQLEEFSDEYDQEKVDSPRPDRREAVGKMVPPQMFILKTRHGFPIPSPERSGHGLSTFLFDFRLLIFDWGKIVQTNLPETALMLLLATGC